MAKATGIRARHSRKCRTQGGGNCSCHPTYEAYVWSKRDGKQIYRSFASLAEAKSWRADAVGEVRRGTMRAPTDTTLRQAAEAWIRDAETGAIWKRSGEKYKPSVVRSYESSLRIHVLPDLGGARLCDITQADLRELVVGRMNKAAYAASTIRNAINSVRVLYRQAKAEVPVNPTAGLDLPTSTGKRDRIASPEEAAKLLAAAPDEDRALWATALYAGLRAGELPGLKWEDVDLPAGLIRVERAYDPKAHEYVAPKSKAGVRKVPIPAVLREHLIAHKLRAGSSDGLVFGRSESTPFDGWAVQTRADKAWKGAELDRITLHEARHTFASLMIAAGVNAKSLQTYMGHSSVTITYDRYGHLMPGNEEEAAGLLDTYLDDAQGRAHAR